jgi:hypothetical protein
MIRLAAFFKYGSRRADHMVANFAEPSQPRLCIRILGPVRAFDLDETGQFRVALDVGAGKEPVKSG